MSSPSPSFVIERRAFRDREEAGDVLVRSLMDLSGHSAVLLAIARGAVPMGDRIARRLGAAFDVLLVRKLAAPDNPEFALGAVDEEGVCTFTPGLEHLIQTQWFQGELTRQRARIAERRALYGPPGSAAGLQGRTVIVVDDGLATGATMVTALDWVRRRGPNRLICAVPVGSSEAIAWAINHADRVVCPWRPAAFGALSHCYRRFEQVSDEEVARYLLRWRSRGGGEPSAPVPIEPQEAQARASNSRM